MKRKSITVSVHIYVQKPTRVDSICTAGVGIGRCAVCVRNGWHDRAGAIGNLLCTEGAACLALWYTCSSPKPGRERGKKNVVKIRDVGNPDNKNKGLLYQYRWSKRTIKDKKSMPEKTKDNGWVLLVYKYMYMGHVAAWVNDVKLDSVGVQRQANRHIFHTVDYVRKPNVRHRYTSQSI